MKPQTSVVTNFFTLFFLVALLFTTSSAKAQTCQELMDFVKSKPYGTTYSSNFTSKAISEVTFYDISDEGETYYFAIVCFKRDFMGCDEYIYQVSSSTESNYSINYFNSAGEAFWDYIHPHRGNLGCAPDFN